MRSVRAVAALALASFAAAVSVTDIQGPAFASPLVGKTVSNVTGIVTAKGSQGFYITGDSNGDPRYSRGLHIFTTSTKIQAMVNVGDLVSLGGVVQEFRSQPIYLTSTEIGSPTNITVLSSNNALPVVVLGVDRSPPTEQYTPLDAGDGGIFAVPNNQSLVQVVNATLQPDSYGLDFWESLEGQLVTIRQPIALNFENSFGEIWVRGNYPVTGVNARGGLSMIRSPNGLPDTQPEAVIIGSPLDGTKNPKVFMGAQFSDITGVVEQEFGFTYILPITAPTLLNAANPTLPVTALTPVNDNCLVTLSDYNVENMWQNSSHIPTVAGHIVNNLLAPEILMLQEIQDNNGPNVDDGTVSANATLAKLVAAISTASNGTVQYSFLDVPPVNDQDGGQPGGNIRVAYLWLANRVQLVHGTPGGSLDANAPFMDTSGRINLKFNPGRIDPTNAAWTSSRKPLAALWEKVGGTGERLVTINVHFSAKDGNGTTEEGDVRPPINVAVQQRIAQVGVMGDFVKSVVALDKDAAVLTAGDWNEFVFVPSVFDQLSGFYHDIDEVAGLPVVERYTYAFDMNSEQLDHVFISDALAARGAQIEHVHVNTGAVSFSKRVSDHDPSVFRVNICAGA